MNEQWSPEEQRLSAALHREAENVTPAPDALAQIRRRTGEQPWWRQPAVLGVAAGVATAAAAVVVTVNLLGTGNDEVSVQPAGSPSVTDSPPPTDSDSTAGPAEPTDDTGSPEPTGDGTEPEPTGTADPNGPGPEDETRTPNVDGNAEQDLALPVYYTVDGYITREWQRVATADPLGAAIHRALNEPAQDPRYESMWAPVDVLSAGVSDGLIEVDLRSPVELADDAADPEQAVQQLVYTATATASALFDDVEAALPVQILVDGTPPERLFGDLDLSEPVTRANQLDVRYFVQIDTPTHGAQVGGSNVTVTGVAATSEAHLLWELRRDGDIVDSGTTNTAEAFTFSEYSFQLSDLEPGSYEVTVMEDDVSGGEGRDPFFETKRFTVTER